ncbi:MAG: glycosyltransferase family protein [Saprospiraceae bacterium]
MKILYAFPATGNGHISRAITLNPYLSKIGQIDYLISGTNSSLSFPYPLKYKFDGISLFYNKDGGLDHSKFFEKLNTRKLYKQIKEIPVENYDWVISDFEPISAWSCLLKGKSCMHWGHQASFKYPETPRPKDRSLLGELLLQRYVRSKCNFGLHFKSYHENITGPVIKNSILESKRFSDDLISVYLPQYNLPSLLSLFDQFSNIDIQIFHPAVAEIQRHNRIELFPINKELFDNSLLHCRLIITGGGFETPSEALYLNKRVISIPIKSHYEQLCNGAAMAKLNVPVIKDLPDLTSDLILSEFELYGKQDNSLQTLAPQEICYMALTYWEKYLDKNYGGFEVYDHLSEGHVQQSLSI